jgi:hypothetical protein
VDAAYRLLPLGGTEGYFRTGYSPGSQSFRQGQGFFNVVNFYDRDNADLSKFLKHLMHDNLF